MNTPAPIRRTSPDPAHAPAPMPPTFDPFENSERLKLSVQEDPDNVLFIHRERLENEREEGFRRGQESQPAISTVGWKIATSLEAAAILILIFCLIFGGNSSSEKLAKENLGYQQVVASLNEGRIEDGKKMKQLESDIKAADSKKQELESKLALANKSAEDAVKEKLEADKKITAAEKRATDLADSASRSDINLKAAESAKTESAKLKGDLEKAEAKIADLQKSVDAAQKERLAMLRASEETPTAVPAAPVPTAPTQFPGDALFSTAPKGLAVGDNPGEPQWKVAMRSFAQKGRNDLAKAAQAGGTNPQNEAAIKNSIAAFDAAAEGRLTDTQKAFLLRFASKGGLVPQSVQDINDAIAASGSGRSFRAPSGKGNSGSRFNLAPN